MHFVYILKSTSLPEKFYVGVTNNPDRRLQEHNAGEISHTVKFRPWKIKNYFAFLEKKKALAFEKYLKSGSGRAFAKKHF